MTALTNAAVLCGELDRLGAPYTLGIVRDEALMVNVAIPGERWEIEFFDDGRCELEIFVSQGVTDATDIVPKVLRYFED